MSSKDKKAQQEKIDFESAMGMIQHVITLWMVEHDYVGTRDELKTPEDWAKDFADNLMSVAEIGPEGQAVYLDKLLNKIVPGSNFLDKYNKIMAGGRN